jgi:hypothetical protein
MRDINWNICLKKFKKKHIKKIYQLKKAILEEKKTFRVFDLIR